MSEAETNRNATDSALGWDFQVNAAIVLFIRHIKDADAIRVEGKHEDVEIFLHDGEKIYGQAKMRTTQNPGDNSTTHFSKALRSLTDAAKQGDCGALYYITNDEYPFGVELKTSIFGDDALLRYEELPDKTREYVAAKAEEVGIKEADLKKFSACVIGFYGDDDNTRYKVIHRYVDQLVNELGLNRHGSIDSHSLRRTWDYMFNKNATKKNLETTIKKTDFVWPLICKLCEVSSEEKDFDECSYDVQEEVLAQYHRLIDEVSERFSFVTKVISDYRDYAFDNPSDSRRKLNIDFVQRNWRNYLDDIGIEDESDETCEILLGIVLRKIIGKHTVITRIKEEVGIDR